MSVHSFLIHAFCRKCPSRLIPIRCASRAEDSFLESIRATTRRNRGVANARSIRAVTASVANPSAAELGRKCPPEFGGVLDFGCAIRFFDSPSTHASDNPAPVLDDKCHRARCQVAARHSGLHGLPSLRETPGFVEQIPAYVAAPVEGEKIPVIAWAVGTEHQPIRPDHTRCRPHRHTYVRHIHAVTVGSFEFVGEWISQCCAALNV